MNQKEPIVCPRRGKAQPTLAQATANAQARAAFARAAADQTPMKSMSQGRAHVRAYYQGDMPEAVFDYGVRA